MTGAKWLSQQWAFSGPHCSGISLIKWACHDHSQQNLQWPGRKWTWNWKTTWRARDDVSQVHKFACWKLAMVLSLDFFFFLFSFNLLLYSASPLQIIGLLPLSFHHVTHREPCITIVDFWPGFSTVMLYLRVWLALMLEVSKLHLLVLLFSVASRN